MLTGRIFTWSLAALVTFVSGRAAFSSLSSESDTDALVRIKVEQNKAPKIDYPKTDVLHRKIPKFDVLIIMPECQSCSDFRKKSRTYMEANPGKTFLILTPDLIDSNDLFRHKNYFVATFDKKSKYAFLPAGAYIHE